MRSSLGLTTLEQRVVREDGAGRIAKVNKLIGAFATKSP
jgi:hypothetical protein